MKVVIYSKDGCKECDNSVTFLKDRGISYEKVTMGKEELSKLCDKRITMYPQIFVDGNYIGDNFDLEEYVDENYEPITEPTLSRFTMFPIKYQKLWNMYKKAQGSFWTAEEIDFGEDIDHWNTLTLDEKHFIKTILAFFAASDGIVYENINSNFANEIQLPEARAFYAYQEYNEQVHSETYSLLIDKYIQDPDEKNTLLNAISTVPCIRKKADWAMKYFNPSLPLAERLLAFVCVEGIFFSGSFCAIFWLKKRGLMPGLCFSNELISRDEGLHQEFGIELIKMLRKSPNEQIVHAIITSAVECEKEFIIDALPCRLIGMNGDMMSTYIEYVADRILKQLGYNTIWGSENPFDFMENISLDGKTNFFEKRVGDYGKSGVGVDQEENQISFTNDDF
tara:strand:- start:981 stop:2162 length:1182 start_codon:yes stop_codon:yes gene_type:complete